MLCVCVLRVVYCVMMVGCSVAAVLCVGVLLIGLCDVCVVYCVLSCGLCWCCCVCVLAGLTVFVRFLCLVCDIV